LLIWRRSKLSRHIRRFHGATAPPMGPRRLPATDVSAADVSAADPGFRQYPPSGLEADCAAIPLRPPRRQMPSAPGNRCRTARSMNLPRTDPE
jgi:hypothetical protein